MLNQIRFFQMNHIMSNSILIRYYFVIPILIWKLKKGTTKNPNIFRKCVVFFKIWFTWKDKKTPAICNLEIFDHEFHNLQTHSQTFNWFHLKHFPLQHKKMSANCARQKYENYESLFHFTVSKKEALQIIDFEISPEKTKLFPILQDSKWDTRNFCNSCGWKISRFIQTINENVVFCHLWLLNRFTTIPEKWKLWGHFFTAQYLNKKHLR